MLAPLNISTITPLDRRTFHARPRLGAGDFVRSAVVCLTVVVMFAATSAVAAPPWLRGTGHWAQPLKDQRGAESAATVAESAVVPAAGTPALPPILGTSPTAAGTETPLELEVLPPRTLVAHPVRTGTGLEGVQSVVGKITLYRPHAGETFLDIARHRGLGHNELLAANPDLDPWVLREGQDVVIPGEWVLPDTAARGLIMNIPEMRLYYFPPKARTGGQRSVYTLPVGLGRQDWQTPIGKFTIRGKTKNPTWIIPQSIRKERLEEDGLTDASIPGGSPDNPLGKYRFELTLPSYAIHGTNKKWGVGMEVSHGCVRLYPEDIESLFPLVPVGTVGAFVYQPVKVGVRDGRVIIEVHEDIYDAAPSGDKLAAALIRKRKLERYVDPDALTAALEAASGLPTDIGFVSGS